MKTKTMYSFSQLARCFSMALIFGILSVLGANAQTTVFEDNFNRGATTATVTDGGTPLMTYTTTIGTAGSGQGAYLNLQIGRGQYLYLKNAAGTAGNIYVSGETSKFTSPFNNVLSSNDSIVEWTFNTYYQNSTIDATGLANTQWGYAVVLAGTNPAFHNAGNGYAIVYGNAGMPDPIRLVKYNNGLQGTLTDIINTSSVINNIDSGTDFASVRVKYIPSTNSWSLYVRDDNTVPYSATPVPDTNQYGTTVVDGTYTSSTMTHFGFFWCHGATAASARFDNFKVTVGVEDQTFVYQGEPKFGYGFSSHMVLQRETNADIYGLAKPGTEVTISIGEQKLTAKANEYGRWLVQITPMEAGGPYILKLQSGTTVVELNDVLIGDVWICAGQSNMRYSLSRPIDYILDGNGTYISDSTIQTLDIKVFADELEALRTQQNFPIRHAMSMGDVTLDWVLVNHENASDVKKYSPGITAVGYFFAKHLRQKLGDVPIGIIQVGNGGAAIREFLPRDVQLADSGMKKMIDSYWPSFVEKHGEEKLASYYQQMGDWLKIGQFGTPPPVEYFDRIPGHLFYHALAPLKKFSFKGFLYYQGESDAGRGDFYAHLLDKFVDVVRDTYEFSDMPFLEVLLPPSARIGYADIVKSQMYVAENKNGVHPVYAPEGAWNHPDNLHAPAKEIVGSRAAMTAFQKVYGGNEPYLGARYASHKVVGNTMIITFKETGGGLVLKAGVNELTGFEIAGVDEKFISVKAKLANETDNVVLSIPENLQDGQQLHVRFQMMKYYVPVLYGKNGLPTVFFRTAASPNAVINPLSDTKINILANTVIINGALNKNLLIATIIGQTVISRKVNNDSEIITLPTGFYVLSIGNDRYKIRIVKN